MAITGCLNKYLGIGEENIDIYPRYSCCYRCVSESSWAKSGLFYTNNFLLVLLLLYHYLEDNVEAEKVGSPNYYVTITITNVNYYLFYYYV